MRRLGALLALLLAACTTDEDRREKQAECDRIADNIERSAMERGLTPQGVCNNPNAPEFGPVCRTLSRCNDELDDM